MTFGHLFLSLLFLDLVGALAVLAAAALSSGGLILFLVLQVYRRVLGVVLLLLCVRKIGTDKIKLLLYVLSSC